jgi:hypothetical protein
MHQWPRRICRVCGLLFTPRRSDARTCSPKCRVALHRGKDLAYLADLPKREQRRDRQLHAEMDEAIAASKRVRAARLAVYHDPARVAAREQRRKQREEQEAKRKERQWFEAIGRFETAQYRYKRVGMAVAGALKLFAHQRRNDMSAEAIAAFFNRRSIDEASPEDRYSVEDIAAELQALREYGDYERIIAEGQALRTAEEQAIKTVPESEVDTP